MFASINRRQLLSMGAAAAVGLAVERSAAAARPSAAPVAVRPQSAAAAGTTPVRLCANENPYGPSPRARKAMLAGLELSNCYPTPALQGDLEKLIADREQVPQDHVLLGSGSGELLCMAGTAYGLGGSEIVAADPSFTWMLRYAEQVGARVRRVPLNAAFEHDLDAMDRSLSKAVKLVYVCNPNNPTATITPAARLRSFCEAAAQRAVVFVDEAYHEYVASPAYASMIELVRKGHHVIVLRTFSKIYGLAGLRVGYAIGRPDIIARLRPFRMSILNQVGLHAAIASYQDQEYVALSRRRNAEARAHLCKGMDELGYRYMPSEANFLYVNVGSANRTLPEKLARQGLLVTWNGAPLEDDWMRITIGTLDDMRRLVAAMREIRKS